MENEMNFDKIIEKSKQWTLEGDCSLLQWMNQISNNLEERVTKTSSDIINMSTKLDRTSIALINATNNLAALQYSKFVENRVHEDDETLTNTAYNASEDVTDKKNSVQDIYSFLKKNVEMMNSCHEAYSFSYEDSEDDDDDEPVTSVVYRSKNPYEARPLPHIYGSAMWKEKWHIGLCDSDNDFSNEENSEQFSESSSTADDSNESTAPTMSEWDSTAWGLNTQHNLERKDMHTPSNDGESSYQGEDYTQSKVSTPRTQKRVPVAQQPIQDQRYYQHVPRRQERMFDDIFDDSQQQQEVAAQVSSAQVIPPAVIPTPQKKIIPESYIPNEPPPDEQSIESESNRRVGAKKTLNLFDDDEFSSFMDQIVQKATNKSIEPNEQSQENSEPPKVTAANLFNDINDHIPPADDSPRQPIRALTANIFDENNGNKKIQPSKTLAPNLFNDSDDLFSPPTEKAPGPTKNISVPNLFNESDDLFTPSISDQPIVKRKSISSKLEDDIFTTSPQSVSIGKTKIKNLFDDDDEDDDFDNIFSSKANTNAKFPQATKNLFSDDLAAEPENNDLAVENTESIKEVPTASPRFINDDKNNIVPKNESAKAPLLKKSSNVQNIFDDSPIVEKEKFSGTPTLKEGSFVKKGLFDDFDELEDENSIFSTKPAQRDSFENLFQKENPKNKFSTIEKKTLFNDEDEKEDTKRIESKKSEIVKETVENKPSDSENIPSFLSDTLINEPPEDIFAPILRVKKTQVDNIFADDVDDDFENFISTTSSKTSKVNDELSIVSESSTKPIETETLPVNEPNPKEPEPISAIAPRLPTIAQKPLVDKTSKPQSKVLTKKIVDSHVSEKTNDEKGSKTKKEELEKSSSSYSEDSRPNSEPLETPQVSATEKTQIDNISKLGSVSDMDVSESSENSVTKKEQITNKKSYVEEDNTQTKMVFKTEEVLKPISNPKPEVTIEYENVSSALKDNTETKKPSTIPSYTSLFHDDIPPEDENPNPTSNEESPLHTVEEDVEAKPISSASSVPYSSINLFADVPPDDYFSVSAQPVVQTQRIHSVFYDDFNETIEAGREMRTPPSYMINDEPPPDDKDNKPVVSEIKKEKPLVSKLKKLDFQINVGALMPSAKLPSFKKPQAVDKSQSDIKINEQNSPSLDSALNNDLISSQSPSIKTRELPENILPNLNKDRVRVQVKRRPSTRMGRRESYRKSMIEEAVSVDNQDDKEMKKSISSSPEDFKTGIQERSIKLDNQEINKNKDEKVEEIKPTGVLETVGKKKEIMEESKETLSKMPDQATLFEESDILFKKSVTSSSSSKATTTKIASLFKNSDVETENIFETIKSNTKKPELETSPMTKNLDSLFDSDEIDENPFGTPKIFLPHSINSKETTKLPEDKSKLDLLFESVQPQESKAKGQPVKTAIKSSEQSAKITSNSLFGDSDDGSDDLFKGARVSKKATSHKKPEQKPKTKQTKPSASLFSSDEDSGSGDDLFGKTKTKTTTKKNEPLVKDKVSSNLFADLSDDDSDGLFGTSTKANKSKANPTKNPVQSTKQPAAPAQQAKSISNNPLSDLLG